MTKWTLPEGRKPLTDALQARVAELVEALEEAIKVADRLNGDGTRYSGLEFARATLAGLTGGRNASY